MGERTTVVLPFGAGLDRALGATMARPDDFDDLRNVELLGGVAVARKGLTQRLALTNAGVALDGVMLIHARRSDRTDLLIGRDGSGLRYAIDAAATSLWDATSVSSLDVLHAAEVNGQSFVAHDPGGFGVPTVPTRYWNGATVTTLQASLDGGAAANVKFRGVVEHLGYLFGWGYGSASDANRPEIVRASLPGQPTVFKAEHYFLAGAKGNRVYRCLPLGQELLVFTETAIFAIIGTNRANFGIVPRDRVYGLAGPRLAVVVDDVCYFWSVHGPRMTTGGASVDLSLPLGLDGPEPTLVTRGGNYQGFAIHVPGKEIVRFVFGRRAYTLHLRDRGNPRWSYDEYGTELHAAGLMYDVDLSSHAYLTPAVGPRFGNTVAWLDRGTLDLADPYTVKAVSNPMAPAGRAGECVFPAVYLTLTHTTAVTLRVTPIVDGVPGTAVDVVLAAKANRTTEVREVPLSVALVQSLVEVGKFFPRGTWFQLQVETVTNVGAGDLLLEEAAVEYDVVTETRVAG